ncbi:MAG: CoA transferase [Alphaproteobacteria bacterium]
MNPLDGIRVLDLTNVLAGPFCCHQLAHMGADVIKVEAVGHGDLARRLGADESLNARGMGVSFLAQNAGKRSVTANLKHPRGREAFLALMRTADVVVENFRPGVMDRLGLGWPALREMRPGLIYCAISGFGQDGPWRDLPAYDQVIRAARGDGGDQGAGRAASAWDSRSATPSAGWPPPSPSPRPGRTRPRPRRWPLHRRLDAGGDAGDHGLGGLRTG